MYSLCGFRSQLLCVPDSVKTKVVIDDDYVEDQKDVVLTPPTSPKIRELIVVKVCKPRTCMIKGIRG